MKFYIPLLILIFIGCTTNSKSEYTPLSTVKSVQIERYLGKWYEIARFEHKFQKDCTATSATYSLREDGDIQVLNQCRLQSPEGKLKTALGRAWVKDTKSNSKLKVQFFLKNFKIPFLAGNYWILELDKDYQHVIIGDPSRKYLWILSRKPKMEDGIYKELVSKAQHLHFDISKLVKTKH